MRRCFVYFVSSGSTSPNSSRSCVASWTPVLVSLLHFLFNVASLLSYPKLLHFLPIQRCFTYYPTLLHFFPIQCCFTSYPTLLHLLRYYRYCFIYFSRQLSAFFVTSNAILTGRLRSVPWPSRSFSLTYIAGFDAPVTLEKVRKAWCCHCLVARQQRCSIVLLYTWKAVFSLCFWKVLSSPNFWKFVSFLESNVLSVLSKGRCFKTAWLHCPLQKLCINGPHEKKCYLYCPPKTLYFHCPLEELCYRCPLKPLCPLENLSSGSCGIPVSTPVSCLHYRDINCLILSTIIREVEAPLSCKFKCGFYLVYRPPFSLSFQSFSVL